METERRALHPDEAAEIFRNEPESLRWKEWMLPSILSGSFLGIVAGLIVVVTFRMAGLSVSDLAGLDPRNLVLIAGLSGTLLFYAYTLWFELRNQKEFALWRERILNADNLIVELHDVAECKICTRSRTRATNVFRSDLRRQDPFRFRRSG